MARLTRSQKKGKKSSYTDRFLKGKISCVEYPKKDETDFKVVSFVNSPNASSVIMKISNTKKHYHFPAPFGTILGQDVTYNKLSSYQVGQLVCNVQLKPGYKGLCFKSAGCSGKITHKDTVITIERQGRSIKFNPNCLAMAGVIGNANKHLKPILKAGTASKMNYAKGKKYPVVSPHKMNAQDSSAGGSYRKSRGRPMTCSRHCPPGRKYGSIAARRTGKK